MAGEFLTACEQAVNAAAGRQLSEQEMENLVSNMERTTARIRAENEGLSLEEAALRAADELARDDLLAKKIEARNRILNTRIINENMAFLDSFRDRPDIGLSAIMVGRNDARAGTRSSAFNEQRSLRAKYMGGLTNDLESAGVLKYLSSGSNDQEIADAMWRLGTGQPTDNITPQSLTVANIVQKWQESARMDANRAGASIGKLAGYIVRQAHDIYKIRSAGFEAWRNAILPKLDMSTFDGLNINDTNAFQVKGAVGMTEAQIYGRAAPAKAIKPENIGKIGTRSDGQKYIKGVMSENVDLMTGNGQVLKARYAEKNLTVSGQPVNVDEVVGFRNDGGEWVSVNNRSPRFDASLPGGAAPSQNAIDDFLHNVYTGLSSGVHLTSDRPDWMSGFKGPSNIARRASQERVLHFKDGNAWYEYNQQFGTGNLREAIASGLDSSASNTGLMRRLGTNPENMFNEMADRVEQRFKDAHDDKSLAAFRGARNSSLTNQLKEITGQTNIPANAALARASMVARTAEAMMKLGGAMISSFNDIPSQAMELRYQGRGLLDSIWEATTNKVALTRWSNSERKEILKSIGLFSDNMRDEMIYRFSGDNTIPGRVNRLQRNYFRLNLLNWWTNSSRYSTGMMVSEWLGRNAGKNFADVPEDLRRAISLHGIGENEWRAYSKMKLAAADGNHYMTPDGVADIPRSAIEEYLVNRGLKVNDRSVAYGRDMLSDKLRGYLLDRVGVALNEPDARTMSVIKQGQQRGTLYGEILRFAWQFKSFTASFMQNALGRELYGRGYTPAALGQNRAKSFANSILNGNGEWQGLVQNILWMTAFGFLSMQTKQILRGQEPRPLDNWKTYQAAFLQGGGIGILGDLFFGEYNRFGGGVASSLLGPAISDANQIGQLYLASINGDARAADYFNFLVSHTPYMNMHIVRPIMDGLILNQMREWMSPGSLERYQQRIKEEQGNDFIIPPSQFMLGK